jgi:hypothetical protein
MTVCFNNEWQHQRIRAWCPALPYAGCRAVQGPQRPLGSGPKRSLHPPVVGVDGPTASRAKVEFSNTNLERPVHYATPLQVSGNIGS